MDESVFSNERPASRFTEIDPLSLTQSAYLQLPASDQFMLRSRARCTVGLTELKALKRRIAECVHINALSSEVSTLQELNRRFHRPASAALIPVSVLVAELVGNAVLRYIPHRTKTLLYSAAVFEEQLKQTGESALALESRIGSFV